MDFKQEIGRLKVAIDKELEQQFDIAIENAKKKDILIADALRQTKKIALAGGKRIRGALLYWAYLGVGGREKKKILKVAAAIEMVHLFLLAHDDVIDRGCLRHGEKTLNSFFIKKKFADENVSHFGNSMAIIAGDLLYVLANEIILKAGFDEKVTIDLLIKLQSVVATTIIGQSQDIAISYNKDVRESQVLAMYENKTARYTFEGPLHMGAGLAKCNDRKIFLALSRYALLLGIAFQIQDDILGIFGNARKLGKSVASDIEEGKKSLMVAKAVKMSTSEQREKINRILGKKNISKKEIEIFKDILKSTGALAYAENLVKKSLAKGKNDIEKVIMLPDSKGFFIGLAEYLQDREM